MADYRSYSYNHTNQDSQFDPKIPNFRSYSVSYAPTHRSNMDIVVAGTNNDWKLQKSKSVSRNWGFGDPEFQRKKRVAGYKVYAVEGKLKGSFRKSFRWIKDKYFRVVYG